MENQNNFTKERVLSKETNIAYFCPRCKKGFIEEIGFSGCPRGSCEADKVGLIITERTFIPNKDGSTRSINK